MTNDARPHTTHTTLSPMERAIPVIPADDIQAMRSFYVDTLGFTLLYDTSDGAREGMIGVERGGICITIDSPMDGHGRRACVSLEVDDADAYYREWSTHVSINRPPQDEEWGKRTFGFQDPADNTIFVMGPVA